MKLLKVKEVTVGGITYPLLYTVRARMEFEDLAADSRSDDIGSTENMFKLFYCAVKAGHKAQETPCPYTLDSFIDEIGDNYHEALKEFTTALMPKGADKKKVTKDQ